ncbi:hypothetical protein DPEC_G00148960 [Dallia pectoralis]|uniref:Uncharacterized protein n=1 Tax=Dallia pectoralis TaxID=75939 RepID=A0ACC2GJ47_DALPE|nr:hypothetical protein DPEC_G00148960 [Dallia pectoralis]
MHQAPVSQEIGSCPGVTLAVTEHAATLPQETPGMEITGQFVCTRVGGRGERQGATYTPRPRFGRKGTGRRRPDEAFKCF